MINASLDENGGGAVLLQTDYIRAGPSTPPDSCDQNDRFIQNDFCEAVWTDLFGR